jgi:hypothetical protein
MANNPLLYDAILAGGVGGASERWITSSESASYAIESINVKNLATVVDGLIAPVPGGASFESALILQSIVQGVIGGRYLIDVSPDLYLDVARAIVALFNAVSVHIVPVSGGGAVVSVFSRTGIVTAQFGDYTSSLIENKSGVAGTTVTTALNNLASAIAALVTGVSSAFGRTGNVVGATGDYAASQITNDSSVAGAEVKDALNTLLAASGGAVTSVFSRTGAVVAATNDYAASQVNNDSSVGGADVKAALNTLLAAIAAQITGVSSVFGRGGAVVSKSGDYAASQVTNDSGLVAGKGVSGALDTLATSISSLVTGVSSVFGRGGAVVSKSGDYAASQVSNDSSVGGADVKAALNALLAAIVAQVTGVSSVFGRAGAVVSKSGDYAASQVTNDSSVVGADVKAALNTLATSEVSIQQFFMGNNPASISPRWLGNVTGGGPTSTQSLAQIAMGTAGVFTRMRVKQAIALATDSLTYQLEINNAVVAASTIVVPAGTTVNTDVTFTQVWAASDLVALRVTQSGTTAAGNRSLSIDVCGYYT